MESLKAVYNDMLTLISARHQRLVRPPAGNKVRRVPVGTGYSLQGGAVGGGCSGCG